MKITLKSLSLCLGVAALLSACLYYESCRKKFNFNEILSALPADPALEVAPLDRAAQENVNAKLQQKFHYLGSGEQCHAFLGEDRKTVLKFFREHNLNNKRVMTSCKLAYELLPEISGILYLHLNKTAHLHGKTRIVGADWREHEIDLDQTEFFVQNYGELICDRFDRQMKENDLAGAIASLQIFFDAIEGWALKGIHVQNPAVKRNVGFHDDMILLLDVGSIKKNSLDRAAVNHEIRKVSSRLRRWIVKHHPALYPHFQEKLNEKTGSDK
jgi:hypothetical protein